MQIKSIALLGAGAVGAYFIWGLNQNEHFCVIAKDGRKKRLESEGLIINGQHFKLNIKTPEEAGKVDLLLISCKYDALESILEDIKKMVGEDTIVVSLLNGVTSEEVIGQVIGMHHMLPAVMRIASVRDGNKITFSPEYTAGVYVGETSLKYGDKRLHAMEGVFESTAIKCNLVEDIMLEMWMKYAGNVSQNLPQAILGVGFNAYKESEHVHYIAVQLWKEVSLIANVKGIPLPEEFQIFRGAKPEARFSTLQDLDAGRHTEIEMLAGDMIRMGQEYGIPVPYCEYTYHLIKSLEEKCDGIIK